MPHPKNINSKIKYIYSYDCSIRVFINFYKSTLINQQN